MIDGYGNIQTDQWIRSLFLGQDKDVYIYSVVTPEIPDDIPGLHIRIDTEDYPTCYWNLAYDGHIYCGGTMII